MIISIGAVSLTLNNPDLGDTYQYSLDSQKMETDQKVVLMNHRTPVNDQQVKLSFSDVCHETFEALTCILRDYQGCEVEIDYLGTCILLGMDTAKQDAQGLWTFGLLLQQLQATDLIVVDEPTTCCA